MLCDSIRNLLNLSEWLRSLDRILQLVTISVQTSMWFLFFLLFTIDSIRFEFFVLSLLWNLEFFFRFLRFFVIKSGNWQGFIELLYLVWCGYVLFQSYDSIGNLRNLRALLSFSRSNQAIKKSLDHWVSLIFVIGSGDPWWFISPFVVIDVVSMFIRLKVVFDW